MATKISSLAFTIFCHGGLYNVRVFLVIQPSPVLCNPVDSSSPGSSGHSHSLGKNTGVGCHAVLQVSIIMSSKYIVFLFSIYFCFFPPWNLLSLSEKILLCLRNYFTLAVCVTSCDTSCIYRIDCIHNIEGAVHSTYQIIDIE